MSQITFVTKYKAPGMFFWRYMFRTVADCVTYRAEKGPDGLIPIPGTEPRLILEDAKGNRLDLPFNGTSLRFSKGRLKLMKSQAAKEAGLPAI